MFGSYPNGQSFKGNGIYRPELQEKIVEICKEPGETMPDLVAGCDIILGNEKDVEKHFGLPSENVDVTQGHSVDAKSYLSILRQLMEMFPRVKKVSKVCHSKTGFQKIKS